MGLPLRQNLKRYLRYLSIGVVWCGFGNGTRSHEFGARSHEFGQSHVSLEQGHMSLDKVT